MRFLILNATESWLILVGSFQCVWLFQCLESPFLSIETQIGEDLHNGWRTILIRFVLNISSFFDVSQGYVLTSILPFLLVKVGDTCLFRHGWSSPPSGSLLGQPQLCFVHVSCSSIIYIHLKLIKHFSANSVLWRFLLYPCSSLPRVQVTYSTTDFWCNKVCSGSLMWQEMWHGSVWYSLWAKD